MNNYAEFIERKRIVDAPTGLPVLPPLNKALFPFQRDIVAWALRRGRAAIFADCGLGKTPMQLEWSKHIQGRVLILAPLAVAAQTVREGAKFGIPVGYAREGGTHLGKITVTNYEMLEHFDPSMFQGIVLDESSILKAYDGKTRTRIIDAFAKTPFRLACTATPAPNDYMELGNHAEFLGVMSRVEMLSMFFVHDGGETQQWRLKGHAEADFWRWLCSWAVMIRRPSDLGYEDGDFKLPELVMHQSTVQVDAPTSGFLFPVEAQTLQERLAARRDTIAERVSDCAAIVLAANDAKLATCGNQNTRKQGGKNTNPTPPSANAENSKAGIAKKTSSTCGNTLSAGRKSLSGQKHSATEDCDQSTELDRLNTLNCSPTKEADALSVESSQAEGGTKDCALTTRTPTGESGDCSAHTAITASGNSKITHEPSKEQWIIWCNLNDEANRAAAAIPGSVNVQGSDSREQKEKAVEDFLAGRIRVLISKPSIFGFGLNLQCCRNIVFLGLSDSYEAYYQAVRRCWRFGQTNSVNVHVITAETEGAVVANIKRKEADAMKMAENMVEHTKDLNAEALKGATQRIKDTYQREVKTGDGWTLHLSDCVEVAQEIPTDSLHYSIYSPPFSSLYTYSNSDRDMGNCKNDDTFMEHYRFLVREMYRAMMPGRLVSFHCMNLPTSKTHHGYIGIRDFRGDLIRLHEAEGFIYHSEVCIWKDPVTAMQRTKSIGLLYKQLRKDSTVSRQGIADYLVTMQKPGENPERVTKTHDSFPVEKWQNYASPVWMDINPSDTLQFRSAREHNDERHIAPLQLQVIERGIELWSNPGDTVFSPFTGIGSEGYVAVKMGRKFLGAELKRSYYEQACRNLDQAKREQGGLFAEVA